MRIGLADLLTLLFVALKLLGVIAWSWLWVLSPIWISFAIVVVILVLAVFGIGFAASRRLG